MSCKSTSGISGYANLVGGLNGSFWIFFKKDLSTQISTKQKSDISSIDFIPYQGFIRFDGFKFKNNYLASLVVENGRRYYATSLNVNVLSQSTETDVIIQTLSKAEDIISIVQDNMGNFFILGSENGLMVSNDSNGSGTKRDEYINDRITFFGKETIRPLRFNIGDYESTLQYLNDHEIERVSVRVFDDTFDETFG